MIPNIQQTTTTTTNEVDIEDLLRQADDLAHESSKLPTATTGRTVAGTDEEEEPSSEKELMVSACIQLPFTADLAFDAFSDLPRQPSFSTWLHSVSYIHDDDDTEQNVRYSPCGIPLRETKWVLGWKKLRYSWNSKVTRVERPYVIEWESTSGLKNRGMIRFVELDDVVGRTTNDDGNTELSSSASSVVTEMRISMALVAPVLVAKLFRRSTKVSAFMKRRMLDPTLLNFRDVLMTNDLNMDAESVGTILARLDEE